MKHSPQIEALFDWLVDGVAGAVTPMDVVARMGKDLVAAGLPIDRLTAFVRTLHPHLVGRRFRWEPGGGDVKVYELKWTDVNATDGTPVGWVYDTGAELRRVLTGPHPTGYQALDEIRQEGFTDYLACPLRFISGSIHAMTFATRAPGGFTDAQLDALRYVCRPLARIAEIFAMFRTAETLLNTYVGRDAGGRILKGSIRRGETEVIRCVIWFSDLRGFTSMSGERPAGEIIATLNELFDCQVPAIDANGGEVLKFMGDGMLAIFPVSEGRTVTEAGAGAVRAAAAAYAELDRANVSRATRGLSKLAFGVALHVGEVAYGNIGGASRLDFTCIGPAVNLASRIEGLTGKLGKRVLLSEELAAQLSTPTEAVGSFELKGVAQAQRVFEPR